jgi:hypothetical protein
MAEIDERTKQAILAKLLRESVWRYSPAQAALLKYLSSSARGKTESEISKHVFANTKHRPAESAIVRVSVHYLRKRLENFFANTPEGRNSAYRIQVALGPTGYHLSFAPNPAAQLPLKVFLCHSSRDKKAVRRLHARLTKDGFLPWLDQQDLLPGQNWEAEIKKAVRKSDVVLACLSPSSITKQGFVQKEIKMALDVADEKPESMIYIIPALLKACAVPERLRQWQWIDLYKPRGYSKLLASLRTLKPASM